jgi:hypothetical protein
LTGKAWDNMLQNKVSKQWKHQLFVEFISFLSFDWLHHLSAPFINQFRLLSQTRRTMERVRGRLNGLLLNVLFTVFNLQKPCSMTRPPTESWVSLQSRLRSVPK